MPDITLPHAPSAGNVTSASGINSDIYDPGASPTSFEVINGWLDADNTDGTLVTWDKVRPRSMGFASSVGATANLDYFSSLFQADPDVYGAFAFIPGAAKEVHAPRDGGSIQVSISVVEANSIPSTITSGSRFRVYRRVDGGAWSALSGLLQVMPPGIRTNRDIYGDRQYTFSYLDIGVDEGSYEYGLAIWMTGSAATLTIVSGLPTTNLISVRVRVRSITATWYG